MTTLPAPGPIQAIISDFIGVLTTPIAGVFTQFQEEIGIPPEALRDALERSAARSGSNPLFELECGRISEGEFLVALEHELEQQFGRHVSMRAFTEHYWSSLSHNEEVVSFLRDARETGYRLALLTNNVQEWEPRWRPKWPIEELFETVVDSGFVGMRKPDPEIYQLTLRRLELPADACVFIDDLEHNVVAARECGLHAVHFRDTEQALGEVRAVLQAAP
ncbi:MAG: putative hydrolase of the superfamily [Solirubrobacteraceae bacterium]|jgi:putative hydrolase of the HAD superfamily|nr:putative hydrolase of the superfamily [Solirubrobacteraceae bacterium]